MATDVTQQATENKMLELREAFAMFDKDGDGKITVKEIENIMSILGQNPTTDEIKQILDEADEDKSGTVEFDEFVKVMEKRMGDESYYCDDELKKSFEIFDKDGDGLISAEEVHRVMTSLGESLTIEEAQEMVREADSNGDGQIDFDEFKSLMQCK